MKLPSLRGLFASVASIAMLAGTLGISAPSQAIATPAASPQIKASAQTAFKLHDVVPYTTAQTAMHQEGWTPVMSGYALKDMETAKGIFSLWKQGDTGNWRILQVTWDGNARLAHEGTGLKLSTPKNPQAKEAVEKNTAALPFNIGVQVVPANHPKDGAQGCGVGLQQTESKKAGFSTVAEGVMGEGTAMMSIGVNYIAEEEDAPVTWAMYMIKAADTSVSCRIDAGYRINFDKGFKGHEPLGYPVPHQS